MYEKYTTGHYVLFPDDDSKAYAEWRLLYRGWYEWDLKSYDIDDAFAFSFERFMAVVARLYISDPGITARDVRGLFRKVSGYTTKEYKRGVDQQRRRERELVGDIACKNAEDEPGVSLEELLQALRELSLEDREFLQTCILIDAYRGGFYRRLSGIYGVSEDAIRNRYRGAVTRLRKILDGQCKLGCPASPGGEPGTS
jgi:DNA-directed RNA polymerase specialized sigma24 family protein